jgi:hypothetical protein
MWIYSVVIFISLLLDGESFAATAKDICNYSAKEGNKKVPMKIDNQTTLINMSLLQKS